MKDKRIRKHCLHEISCLDYRDNLTLNMDENLIESVVKENTRAIVQVHYVGLGCETNTIMDIARRHGLLVVRGTAQGVNVTYKGCYLGAIGHFGTYEYPGL